MSAHESGGVHRAVRCAEFTHEHRDSPLFGVALPLEEARLYGVEAWRAAQDRGDLVVMRRKDYALAFGAGEACGKNDGGCAGWVEEEERIVCRVSDARRHLCIESGERRGFPGLDVGGAPAGLVDHLEANHARAVL